MGVIVQQKVSWLHILGGQNRQRLTYDQITMPQFVQGFANASHAVLLCEMEMGKVTWADTTRIDRVRRTYAQKHQDNARQKWGSKIGEKIVVLQTVSKWNVYIR